jgi:hypothetical protein
MINKILQATMHAPKQEKFKEFGGAWLDVNKGMMYQIIGRTY